MKKLIAILSIFTIFSCSTIKPQPKIEVKTITKDSLVLHDSTVIKTIIRDSVAIIPGVKGKDSLPCNQNQSYVIKRGNDSFKIKIKDGIVYFDYDISSTINEYKSQIDSLTKSNSTIQKDSSDNSTTITLPPIETKYVPWWVKMLAWFGAINIIYWTIKITLLIYKPKV